MQEEDPVMSTYHRLDDIRMSAIDRAHAKAHMQSAEQIVDFVFAAVTKARVLTTAVTHRLNSLAFRLPYSRRQTAQ
jgi:hypothetical protein